MERLIKTVKSYLSLICLLACFFASAQKVRTVPGSESARKSSDAYLISGVEQYLAGKTKAADTLLNRALILNPDNDAAHYYLGKIALSSGEPGEALQNYEAAYRMDTSNVWYAMRLASLYSSTGRFREADKLYGRLLEKRPYDPDMLAEIADLYVKESRYDDADSTFSLIERLTGPSDYIQLARIELNHLRGHYPEFFEGINEYFARKDVQAQTKTKMLEGLIQSGNNKFNFYHVGDYTRLMETCMDVHPDDTSVIHLGASFFFSVGNDAKALELCRKCPEDFQMVVLEAYVMNRASDYKGVVNSCSRALLLTGDLDDRVMLHTMMGDAWQMMGESKNAYSEYEAALALNPDELTTLNNYAYFMACEGKNLSKCAKMAEKVIEAKPTDATSLDTYAWILYKQKKYSQAKTVFKKALLCGGKDNAEVLLQYAQTLEALGELKEAELYYERAKLKEDAKK